MKIWIERYKSWLFFIHFSEPTHMEDDAGWYSSRSELEFSPTAKERRELNRNISNGQVAEFDLKTLWEPINE